MKLIRNRYLIWLIGILIFLFSPQNADLWTDLKRLYLSGVSYFYIEKYPYAFLSWYFWIIRVFSIVLNIKIVRDRRNDPPLLFWMPFALFLPSVSLIVNGFLMIKDSKIRKKIIRFTCVTICLIFAGIYFTGLIERNIVYKENISKMNSLMEEFEIQNLDTSLIAKIDLIVATQDTSDIVKYCVSSTGDLEKIKHPNMVPFDAKLMVQIKYDADLKIQYTIENSLTNPSGVSLSAFDESGKLIMRDLYYNHYTIEIVERIKEYYNNGILIKKEYSKQSLNNLTNDVNDYVLDNERYEFMIYKTTSDFKEHYKIE